MKAENNSLQKLDIFIQDLNEYCNQVAEIAMDKFKAIQVIQKIEMKIN